MCVIEITERLSAISDLIGVISGLVLLVLCYQWPNAIK
jgi:hypothetical protein